MHTQLSHYHTLRSYIDDRGSPKKLNIGDFFLIFLWRVITISLENCPIAGSTLNLTAPLEFTVAVP